MVKVTIGQYYPGASVIHSLDPRVKLLGTLAYIVTLFFIRNSLLFILPLAIILLLYKLSKVPISYIFKGLSPFIILLIFTFIIRGFFTNGTPIFSLWGITLTKQGLNQAVKLMARIVLMIMCASLLTYTTTPNNLAQGLAKSFNFLEKFHVPVADMAVMIEITFRFIPIMIEEANVIMDAQTARGVDFHSGSIFKRMKNVMMIVIPLFISSIKRSDDLAMAMESRGFRDSNHRSHLHVLVYSKRDHISYGIIGFYALVIILMVLIFR